MLNSSQTFRKYFCPPLFSELESCAVPERIYNPITVMFTFQLDNTKR